MTRRDFITLLGGAAAAWPFAARAQQPPTPLVGFLDSVSVETRRDALVAFRQGLAETGHLDSHNVAIEYRWAQGQLNRLPDLAADLVRRQVAVIVVNNAAARAARGATSVTPIVFVSGADPVRTGLVSNLSRPTDNMTGVSYFGGPELVTKRAARRTGRADHRHPALRLASPWDYFMNVFQRPLPSLRSWTQTMSKSKPSCEKRSRRLAN
jgi:putative tryptophan/tyrosine transport system substrate-binding protein